MHALKLLFLEFVKYNKNFLTSIQITNYKCIQCIQIIFIGDFVVV